MSYDSNMSALYQYFPYANTAGGMTGIYKGVILAQWAHESNFFKSDVFINANNAAGIKYVPGVSIASGNYGAYAKYSSLDQFVQDYARVMNLSIYRNIRGASSPEAAIAAFNQYVDGERYAEDDAYSQEVLSIYNQYGMSGFNNYTGGPVPSSNAGGASTGKYSTAELAGIGAAVVAVMALLKN